MKRGFALRALPFLLAAAILAGGILAPRLLLRLRQREYVRESVTVQTGEVHPYGEDYELTKQHLLTAARAMLTGEANYEVLVSDTDADKAQRLQLEQGMAAAKDFLAVWDAAVPEVCLLEQPDMNQSWSLLPCENIDGLTLIRLREYNEAVGGYYLLDFDAQTGALLGGEFERYADCDDDETCARQAWDGLRQAYADLCGLSFEEGAMDAVTYWDGEYGYSVTARSSDLAFRLEFYLHIHSRRSNTWFLTVLLYANE